MDSRHQAHRVADGVLAAKVAGCGEPYSGRGEGRMRTAVRVGCRGGSTPQRRVALCDQREVSETKVQCVNQVSARRSVRGGQCVRSVRGGADAAGRPSMGSADAFRRSDVSEPRDGDWVLAQK